MFLLFLGIGFSANAHALQINGYDPARHDRFVPGTYAGNPVNNPDFFASQYDWSGVGWNSSYPSQSITMISPLHYICAWHYQIPVGGSLSFSNRDGELKSYNVAKNTIFYHPNGNLAGDFALGWLDEPISESDNIGYYPILDVENDWCFDKEVYMYGWNARVATNIVENEPRYSYLKTDFNGGYIDEGYCQGGDSGSPLFMTWNNQLALLGIHVQIQPSHLITNHEYLPDKVFPYLNPAMAEAGYAVDTITIPEPSTILLLGVGLVGIFAGRRKLKR